MQQIQSENNVQFGFRRFGGTIITARVDIWAPTKNNDWQLIQSMNFGGTQQAQQFKYHLLPGKYTCVFSCLVQESLNGVFNFDFYVNNEPIYHDQGNVDTSPADPNQKKPYLDKFELSIV